MVKFNSDVVFLDTSGQIRCDNGSLTLRGDDTGLADIIVGSGKSLRPEIDCRIDLGSDYLRWRTLHACSGQIGNINGLNFGRLLPVDARRASGNIIPDITSNYNIGSSTFPWDQIYCNIINATIHANSLGIAGGPMAFVGPLYPFTTNVYPLGRSIARWSHIVAASGILANLNGIEFGRLLPVDSRQASGHITPNATNTFNLGTPARRWSHVRGASGVFDSLSGTLTNGTLNVVAHLVPSGDCVYDLGTSTKRWNNLYACSGHIDNINGLNFNRLLPVDAREASGNIIPTIDVEWDLGSTDKRWSVGYISNIRAANIYGTDGLTSPWNSSPIYPAVDAAFNLGSPSFRWAHIYAVSGAFSTINGLNITRLYPVDAREASGHIIPNTNITYDLGSVSKKWRNGFFNGVVTETIEAAGPTLSLLTSTVGSSLTLSDNLTLQNSSNLILEDGAVVANHLVPSPTNTYDLGTSSLRWAHIFAASGVFDFIGTNASFITSNANWLFTGTSISFASAAVTADSLTVNSDLTVSDFFDCQASIISDLVPNESNTYDLGLEFFKWDNIYGGHGRFNDVRTASGIIDNLTSSQTNQRTTLNGSGIAVRNEIVRWDSALGFSNSNGQTFIPFAKDGANLRFAFGIGYPVNVKLDKTFSVFNRNNNALATPTWYIIVRKRGSAGGGYADNLTTDVASGLVHFSTAAFGSRGHAGQWMYASESDLELTPSESLEMILHNNGSGLAIDAPSCRLTWGLLENIPNSGISL